MANKQQEALTMKQLIADQNRLLAEGLQIEKDRLSTDKEILSNQMDIDNSVKDQLKQLEFQKAEKAAILRATNSISKISENIATLGKDDLTNTKSLNKLTNDKLKIDKNIRSLRQAQSKLNKEQLGLTKEQVEANFSLSESIDEQVNNAIILKAEMGLVNNTVENIANAKGVTMFGGVEKVLDKIPLLSGLAPMFGAAAKEAEGVAADMEKRKFGADKFAELRKEGMNVKDALEASGSTAEDITTNMKGGFSKAAIDSKSMAAGAKGMASSIMKTLGPAALLAALVTALVGADKASSEMAKSMNMSYSDALKMRSELTSAAAASGNLFVTTKGMQESLMAVNSALGTGGELNADMLTQMTEMREMAGFTNEELQGIAAISLTTGASMNDVTGEFMAQAKLASIRNGVLLNEKDLLKGIKDVSAATTLSLGQDAGLIGDAVATAKSLGMELNAVDAIASSLLSFESSISAELEAELLTGKELNLEKARQFALNNDLAGVAREIAKQAGSAAEFGKMNRIQQEALAKAVGMGRDDLAKTLFIQEQLAGATGDAAKEQEDLLNRRIEEVGLAQAQKEMKKDGIKGLREQAGNADKLAATMAKVQEIFVGLAGPILEVVSPIVDILLPALKLIPIILAPVFDTFKGIAGILTGSTESLSTMETIMGAIGITALAYLATTKSIALYKGIIAMRDANSNIMAAAGVALENSKKKGILSTIGALTIQLGIKLGILSASLATNAAITFGIGVAIAVAAAAAGYAAIKSMTKAGDMNSPADGKTVVSTKEGGLFELSPNDDLIAAPGASKMANNTSSGGINIEPLVTRMAAVENVLIQILQKETGIYLDSNKIGKTMQLSTSRMG